LFFSRQPAGSQAVQNFPLPPKLGHFAGYFMLAAATYWGLQGNKLLRVPWGRAAPGSFLWALWVAFLDEFNQSFLPSRTGSIYDVFIDAAGAATALLLLLGAAALSQRITRESLRSQEKD
jgi:VanZ family protein